MESKNLKDKFRDRLKKIIAKKFDTTMIFALSQVELAFGSHWGHGKPFEQLTDEEKVNYNKWRQCRNNILNQGNTQKRNAYAEIDMYDVVWLRHQTTFFVPQQDNQDN